MLSSDQIETTHQYKMYSDPLDYIPSVYDPIQVVNNPEFIHFCYSVHCFERARDEVLIYY